MNNPIKELFERDIDNVDPLAPMNFFEIPNIGGLTFFGLRVPLVGNWHYVDVDTRIAELHSRTEKRSVRFRPTKMLLRLMLEPTYDNAREYIKEVVTKIKEDFKTMDEEQFRFLHGSPDDLENRLEKLSGMSNEELDALLSEVNKRREEIFIPYWKSVSEHEHLNEYGMHLLQKETPFALFSLDVQDKSLLRCNPDKAGGDSKYVWSRMLSYSGSDFINEFSEEETKALDKVKTVDIAIHPDFDSEWYRFGFAHDWVNAGNVGLGNSFRYPFDIVYYIYHHLYDELKLNPILVGRGMLYEGLDENGNKTRVAFIDTHGDQELIMKKPNLIEAIKKAKKEYHIDFFGLIVGESSIHRNINPYTAFKPSDKENEHVLYDVDIIEIEKL